MAPSGAYCHFRSVDGAIGQSFDGANVMTVRRCIRSEVFIFQLYLLTQCVWRKLYKLSQSCLLEKIQKLLIDLFAIKTFKRIQRDSVFEYSRKESYVLYSKICLKSAA